jgi:hypothetical protein
MDLYMQLTPDADPQVAARLLNVYDDLEITGPDRSRGWTIAGAESSVLMVLEAMRGFSLVERFWVL